jgi:stage II sporulation protein D
MPAEFEAEALKAQALTAITYIVNHLLHQDNPGDSEVTDTVQHQVYKSEQDLQKQWGKEFEPKMKKVKEAVAATSGQILTYKNAPITPAFFSTSNGYTENSEDYWDNELPYLRSVKSKWDEDSPKFADQATFPISQVEAALNVSLPHTGQIPVEVSRTDSNRVSKLEIGGQTFSGREIREKLELQSSDFSIKQKNNHLIFTTKGFGHGIGMSQYGANGMAKEGKNYEDIVKYYYKDVEVSTINETTPTLVAK